MAMTIPPPTSNVPAANSTTSSGGISGATGTLSEAWLQRLSPETVKKILTDQRILQEMLAADGLFGVINGVWDISAQPVRDQATQLANEIKTVDLQIRNLQQTITNEDSDSQAPEQILGLIDQGQALLVRSKQCYEELKTIAGQNIGSTVIQNLSEEGRLAAQRSERTADLWQPAEEAARQAIAEKNEESRLQTTSRPDGFASLIAEVKTLADGTREYVPVGNSLLLNLTGGNDTLVAKFENGHSFLNLNDQGWIRIPANVTRVVVSGRAGDDTFDFTDRNWNIATIVWGGEGRDLLQRNRFSAAILPENEGFDIQAGGTTPGTVGGSTLDPD